MGSNCLYRTSADDKRNNSSGNNMFLIKCAVSCFQRVYENVFPPQIVTAIVVVEYSRINRHIEITHSTSPWVRKMLPDVHSGRPFQKSNLDLHCEV